MQMPHFTRLCVLLLALAAGGAQTVEAAPNAVEAGPGSASDDRSRRIVIADSGMSLDQAVSMVEKRYKARVVRTEVRNEGNRKIYVLRLLNDAGRVWTVRVDASSGSVS
jgi:uncharacterized membrane protein YkoI